MNITKAAFGLIILFSFLNQSCNKDEAMPVLPKLTTTSATNVGSTFAKLGGNIAEDGGSPVTARGVCWGLASKPTVSLGTKTNDGVGKGVFVSNLSGLSLGVTYFARAYATNSAGTAYGNEVTFKTLNSPLLSTSSATNLTGTSVTSGGDITSDGGSSISVRGVCWDVNANPTAQLSTKTSNGSGVGLFTSNITSLVIGTKYYIRAYATNAAGTSYGNEIVVVTKGKPELETLNPTNITTSSIQTGGKVSGDGGESVNARGVCWSTTNNPTIDLPTKTIDGSGVGSFSSTISNLTPNKIYFVRAYATNSLGTSYGNEVSFNTLPDPNTDFLIFIDKPSKTNTIVASLHEKSQIDFNFYGDTDASGTIIKINGLTLHKTNKPDTIYYFLFDQKMRVKSISASISGKKPSSIMTFTYNNTQIIMSTYSIDPTTQVATIKEKLVLDNMSLSFLDHKSFRTEATTQVRLAKDAVIAAIGGLMVNHALYAGAGAVLGVTMTPIVVGVVGIVILKYAINDVTKLTKTLWDDLQMKTNQAEDLIFENGTEGELDSSSYPTNPVTILASILSANPSLEWCTCSVTYDFPYWPYIVSGNTIINYGVFNSNITCCIISTNTTLTKPTYCGFGGGIDTRTVTGSRVFKLKPGNSIDLIFSYSTAICETNAPATYTKTYKCECPE